jgi:hypothetical protein
MDSYDELFGDAIEGEVTEQPMDGEELLPE